MHQRSNDCLSSGSEQNGKGSYGLASAKGEAFPFPSGTIHRPTISSCDLWSHIYVFWSGLSSMHVSSAFLIIESRFFCNLCWNSYDQSSADADIQRHPCRPRILHTHDAQGTSDGLQPTSDGLQPELRKVSECWGVKQRPHRTFKCSFFHSFQDESWCVKTYT